MEPLTDEQKKLAEQYTKKYGRKVLHAMRKSYPSLMAAAKIVNLDDDDLLSCANDAIVKAAYMYDPSRGATFDTYALIWMRSYVSNAVRRADISKFSSLTREPKAKTEDVPYVSDLKHTISEVHRALNSLDIRLCTVLCMRFGLCGYRRLLLREVGAELGMTKERARQLETKALYDMYVLLKRREKCET